MDLFENKKNEEKINGEQLSLNFDAAPGTQPEEKNETQETIKQAPESPAVPPTPENNEEKNDTVAKPEKEAHPDTSPEIKPEKKKTRKSKLVTDKSAVQPGTFGKALQDMRVKNGFGVSQVAQLTRIKEKYIELLEIEKLRTELPSVYVLAYARKLCACYKASNAQTEAILSDLKSSLDNSFSSEIIGNIHLDYEVDEENQKKFRHLVWLMLGAVIVFIILVGIAVFMLKSSPETVKPKPISGQLPQNSRAMEKFEEEKLKELQTPVIIEASELPAKND